MATGFNEDGLVLEANYAATMDNEVLPALRARARQLTVTGEQGKPLFAETLAADRPAGTVVIVHGFTENAYKYAELIWSLLQNGLNVVAYDQRGHGRSWRDERITDLSLTHVTHFQEYVGDLDAVVRQALRDQPRPWKVFSHSMGGAVTALYLESHQDVFSRAVFCAPMIAPRRNGIPLTAGKALFHTLNWLGKGTQRMPMSQPYAGPEDFATSAASGRARFEWYDAVKAREKLFQNNGPSNSWTLQAVKVTDRILADGAVERIACPARVYGAEEDGSVRQEEQQMFADRLKQGGRTVVPGSRHEIYRSPDSVLFPWWHEVLAFLKAQDGDAQ